MTVTLSNGSVITIKAGESVGTVVVDTPANDVYNNGSPSHHNYRCTGGNFEDRDLNQPRADPGDCHFEQWLGDHHQGR
nr:immunoglobulin-like domain-containing protein [Pseudomonas sp. IB20]